jgi:hypothetical protein
VIRIASSNRLAVSDKEPSLEFLRTGFLGLSWNFSCKVMSMDDFRPGLVSRTATFCEAYFRSAMRPDVDMVEDSLDLAVAGLLSHRLNDRNEHELEDEEQSSADGSFLE